MTVLDLRSAKRIFYGAAEASEVWVGGQMVWRRSTVYTFPVDLIAAGGDYVHYAVEDAGGATWTARNGLPLSLDRSGTVSKAKTGLVDYLDCTSGCYTVDRNEGFPSNSPFSLWACSAGNRPSGKDFYIGPPSYQNGTGTMQFYSSSRVDIGATRFNVQWDLPAANGPESFEWLRPASGALSAWQGYHNGVQRTSIMGDDRTASSAGTAIVIGGTRGSSGSSDPGGTMIRDILLTIGWNMNAEQRAAMEAYRLRRIAA